MNAQTETKPARPAMNGVDTPNLLGTINVVAGQPELAKFEFRATTDWQTGTHSISTMHGFSGAGGEQTHRTTYSVDTDHPAVLCGADRGVTPVEHLLHALGACIVAGIGNIASVRGVKLNKVTANVTGDIDLRGLLGISEDVRNGYQGIQVTVDIDGDAPREKLEAIVEQSRKRSAVFDVLTNGVPVTIGTAA